MKRSLRWPAAVTSIIFLLSMVLGLGLQPQPTAAARAVMTLADSNQAWSNGRFFRTGLANSAAPTFGGVQLIPAKVQEAYATSRALPITLSGHTSVTYRSRIFVVGGNTTGTGSELYKSNAFFTTRLADPQTGALEPWVTLPPLPIAVADASSVLVEVGGIPYLVVLGGILGRETADESRQVDTVTTSRIFYFPIILDGQGNINSLQSWREITTNEQRIPIEPNTEFLDPPSEELAGGGARNMGAASVVVNGTPYIYIFGGNNRTLVTNQYVDRYSSRVYRARVAAGAIPGTLTLAWQNDANDNHWNIRGTVNNSLQTVHLSSPATVKYADPMTGNTGVYLIGGKRCIASCDGETANPQYEADLNAYVARINGMTGMVDWLESGNMTPEGRFAHAALESEGQVVVSGGQFKSAEQTAPTDPTAVMAEGYINPDLTLYREGEAANFNLSQGAMNQGRAFHTMETLDGGFYGDYAYIIGGTTRSGQATSPATSDVLVGNLDAEPLETTNVVASGVYYSKTYDFGANAKFYDLRWSAKSEETPIQMLYRYGDSEATLSQWTTVPSQTPTLESDGRKSYTFVFGNTAISSRYFQFMAKIERSPLSLTTSPLLKSVLLNVERVGYPNIRIGPAGGSITPNPINPTGKIEQIVPVTNQPYRKSATETIPALAANWDAEGSFFVGLYVLPPNTNKPHADWPTFGDTGLAYAEVGKSSLPAMLEGEQFFIPRSTWRRWSDSTATNDQFWRSIFTQAGTYTVYVMMDTLPYDPATTPDPNDDWGNVVESEVARRDGETDNVSFFTVEVLDPGNRLFLPIIFGKPSTTAQAVQPLMWPHTIQ